MSPVSCDSQEKIPPKVVLIFWAHMLIVSRHMLFRYLKQDSVSGHRWTLFTSQAIQWWRSVPGRRRPAGAKSDNDESMTAKSEARVTRADLHARSPLMSMPPEVHTPHPSRRHSVRKLAAAIGSVSNVWGYVLGPCDANGLNFRWQGSSMVPCF